MDIDVLGVCAAYPAACDACSGYLVTSGQIRLLVDCGPGVMGNLPRVSSYFDLSGILISHLHSDHYLDLHPLRYALTYSIYRPEGFMPIPLLMPPGEYTRMFSGALDDQEKFNQVFSSEDMSIPRHFDEGKLTIDFALMKHPLQSFAVRITDSQGKKLVYSGDTAYNETLIELAQDADLFLCEATLQNQYAHLAGNGHLTAAQAGDVARQARVKKLVLTHIWPEYDRTVSLEEAAATYSGPLEIAETNTRITV
jgi:ribonuclease BN (tRNA processing enzyme)